MAARSGVPGLSDVVCTENGGPFPSDQFSSRHVTTTATRASLGQRKPPLRVCCSISIGSGNGFVGSLGEARIEGLGDINLRVLHVLVERRDDAQAVRGERLGDDTV